MNKVTLAGKYPPGTSELLSALLPKDFAIDFAETQEALDAHTKLQYLILRTLKANQQLIQNNPGLELIHRWGVGYDSVDVQAATKNGVKVVIATGINTNAVAELALTFMLSIYRHIVPLHSKTASGEWDRTTYTTNSFTIRNKVVGLIGCGNIGRSIAQKVTALGASVQYYDVHRMSVEQETALGVKFSDFETVLQTSDIISLHLPLTEATKNIIDAKQLTMMKPNAILINTARGGLINEAALCEALRNKAILGCALDTYSVEPYDGSGQFGQLDNVILTPHVGGIVDDLTHEMVKKISENILKVALGQPLSKVDWVNEPN